MTSKNLDSLKQRLLSDSGPVPGAAVATAAGDENSVPLSRTTSRTKTVVPKRRRQTAKDNEVVHSGTTYAAVLGGAIDIAALETQWQQQPQSTAQLTDLRRFVNCVICMEKLKQVYLLTVFDDLEVFVFNFGVIVGWGLTETQFNTIIGLIRPFVADGLKDIMRDAVLYTTLAARESTVPPAAAVAVAVAVGSKQSIRFDNINLNTTNYFEKLAYSYALGQSVKLDAFENEVSGTINDTQEIPVHLATHGAISLDNKTVTIKMGELFVQRCNVNLHSDILGTPDIFWDYDEFERMYVGMREYLDIDKRLDILNQRLDIMKDMYTILQNQLNVKHAHKLEMVVIILIVAEIFLQIVALVVTFFASHNK